MNTNKIKLLVITLIAAGNLSSCANNEDIDFSNIENLFQQPLPVIQECVQGKWKWVCWIPVSGIDENGNGILTGGPAYYDDMYVEITENKIIIIRSKRIENPFLDDEPILYTEISYVWKKKETIDGYSTFVMWDIERNQGVWYFDKIQKDILRVSHFSDNKSDRSHSQFVKF